MQKHPNQRNVQPREIAITLQKSEEKGLGFLVKERFSKPHVVVSEILKGGPAEENGLLRVGDVILAVNQNSLAQVSYKDALKKLRAVSFNAKAVLIVRGKETITPHLQAVVTRNGIGRTLRMPKPLPQIKVNKEKAVSAEKKYKVKEKKKERTTTKKKKEIEKMEKPLHTNNPPQNGDVKKKALPPVLKEPTETRTLQPLGSRRSAPPSASNYSVLKNWENFSERRDTLHLKACPVNVCEPNQCKGSVMNPTQMVVDPRTWERSIEETHRLAKDFIDQYFESTKRTGSIAHNDRLNEVKNSIENTGSYLLTEPELIFGAKMAWRNAPRCIGRIQWNKLHVYDCRHVTTTAEMFEAICRHIKYATNKGNIRSCITFFPPRNDVKTEFRVWNPQLIRYAGYQQNDGNVVGDPVNVEFTQICERLGWKGKGTRFDLLPLVLQAHGEDPDLYEIPEDIILEVELRHPEYKWWEELEMKWYAVPAVSNMLLDIGGIQFPACPFNGWFMGTEIARDLCDVSRYNLLEPIALKMGLNVSNLSSLWKDKALLEMNVAILHSFQVDRITIMDHHVATESFMKHFENEMKLRNGCPGDWVWLVPPISGSVTPIFHQEILNYVLNPNCYYQPDPWKYYTWKDQDAVAKSRRKKIRFKDLARSVVLTSSMMTKAMSKRIKATIIYATETGKSQAYAEQLKDVFNFAFNSKVIAMSDYDIWKLEYETLVLVVTSTFGNGDPPENGEAFAQELQKLVRSDKKPGRKQRFDSLVAQAPIHRRRSYFQRIQSEESLATEQQGQLANVKFSVFGLGSTAYPNFCAFAHAIDTMLGEMGAERLLQIAEGDELAGQEESFRNWTKAVFTTACETFCIDEDVNIDDATDGIETRSYDKSKCRVNVQEQKEKETDYINDLGKVHRKNVLACKLAERVDLHPRKSCRATILVKLQKQDPSLLQYEPGDHIGIYPRNDPKLVRELLNRIQDVPHESTLVQLEVLEEKRTALGRFKNWISDKRLPLCSLWTAFSRYLDITAPPTPQFLKQLADCAVNDEDKARLEVLSKGSQEYDEWKLFKMATLVEVLDEFSSIRVELSLLLSQLPLLQCRYYSISSSPDVYPDQIHCTISVVSFFSQGGNGPLHHGVCSTFMDRVDHDESIACFIRHAHSFHLPPTMSTPCILVGPGTGIAPFRSFWQQRIHMIQKQQNPNADTMALLFGCRYESDHIYKEEVEEAVKLRALSHTFTAYSRLSNAPKTYVQDIMKNQLANFVFDTLCKRLGHLYVCGDVTMANDVTKAFKKILMDVGDMNEGEAESWIQDMKHDERYHEDIFGVTLRIKEVHENVRSEAKRKSVINNQG